MQTIKEIKEKYYNKIDLLDLELIISRVLKKPREFVLTHPEHKIIKNYELRIKNYVNRRMKNEPLVYILGHREFYGFNFKVNKNTLIPRPETEMMVDEALNYSKQTTVNRQQNKTIFIDIGTGSGCIIITLAKIINRHSKINNQQFLAADISSKALSIARQNAKFHKVGKKIKFLHGNLLEPIIKNSKFDIRNSTFVILANLPYLTPKQIKTSPTIKYEPKLALTAGRDGLKYYRQLFNQIKKLESLRVPCYALCEINPGQTSKLKKIIKNNFPKAIIKIKKDLSGLNRIVIAQI